LTYQAATLGKQQCSRASLSPAADKRWWKNRHGAVLLRFSGKTCSLLTVVRALKTARLFLVI